MYYVDDVITYDFSYFVFFSLQNCFKTSTSSKKNGLQIVSSTFYIFSLCPNNNIKLLFLASHMSMHVGCAYNVGIGRLHYHSLGEHHFISGVGVGAGFQEKKHFTDLTSKTNKLCPIKNPREVKNQNRFCRRRTLNFHAPVDI